jgi:hypothetical protein
MSEKEHYGKVNMKRFISIEELFFDEFKEDHLLMEKFPISEIKKKIVLYRGVADKDFSNEPSVNRNLSTGGKALTTEVEKEYYTELKKLDFFKAYENMDPNIAFLARAQHYGYSSRLLDISYRKLTGIYFASSLYFDKDGKLYTYSHMNNKTADNTVQFKYLFLYDPTVDDNRKSIKRKLLLLSNNSHKVINNPNFVDEVRVYEKIKSVNSVMEHLSEPVIIIDKNEFYEHNDSNDIRYESQKGLFILYGNQSKNGIITNEINYQSLSSNNLEYVRAEDKLVFLYKLSLNGVNYVTIYPDDDKSHKINRLIKMLLVLNGMYSKNLNRNLNEYSTVFETNELKVVLQKLIKKNEQGVIQFLLSDFYEFSKKFIKNRDKYKKHIINFESHYPSVCNSFKKIILTKQPTKI